MKVDFDRERAWWDGKAPNEEQDLADEAVNRALRWREIERHLADVRTILDVGAGMGAFSIPLTRQGFAVTHVDFSPAMLALARRKVRELENVHFLEANAVALPFPDRSFDLVLNMDGAISFCGSLAEQALRETCRVTRQALIFTVSHRTWMIPVWVSASVKVAGRLLPAVGAMFNRGEWHQEQFPENPLLTKVLTQDYLGAFRAFLPGELQASWRGRECGACAAVDWAPWRTSVARRRWSRYARAKPYYRVSWTCASSSIGRCCRKAPAPGSEQGLSLWPCRREEDD